MHFVFINRRGGLMVKVLVFGLKSANDCAFESRPRRYSFCTHSFGFEHIALARVFSENQAKLIIIYLP